MPRRRPVNGLDVMDDIVEKAVEVVFDKGAEFFQRAREKQVAQIPAEARTQAYACMACKRSPFTLDQMEVVSAPMPGFGMCRGCFAFVWKAGEEKVKYLTKKAQEAQRNRPPEVPEPPPRPPPWLILGIDKDASIEDIKKAWRNLAAKYHPDMVPPGPNATAERDAARLKFEEVTRARDVMVKLRSPPTAAGG
jgi:hypothetical protein